MTARWRLDLSAEFLRSSTADAAKVANPAKVSDNLSHFSRFSSPSASDPAEIEEQIAVALDGNGRDPAGKLACLPEVIAALGQDRPDPSIPREWVDGVARLRAMSCPATLLPEQWHALIDATGRLLDGWGARLAQLGWGATDIFGLDPIRPLDRLDRAGLIAVLPDREVIAITADTITLRTASGATQTFRRKPGQGAGTPIWNLSSGGSDG